jgi:hypothetical protein
MLLPQVVKMQFFFRRTIIDIVTMALSFKKKLHEIWYYHITLYYCIPYYNVIWHYHITL